MRRVPISLQIANYLNLQAQIGWMVFALGMIFFWIFALNADLSFLTFRGSHETTDGRVVRVENTAATENDERVRALHYQYSVAGRLRTGTSYTTTGETVEPGASVTVEYDERDPSRSRIEGMRRALFGPWTLFVCFVPFTGAAILIWATLRGVKRNRLLRDGLIANGKLIAKRATLMRVNWRPVYELKFEFTARDGRRYQATTRTAYTARFQDEAEEPLLYDPNNPAYAFVLDEMPSRPQFDRNGELRGNLAEAVVLLLVPALAILVNGWLLWNMT
ncbi:MAG: DUF3592 domain-containing protein [Thermoanaerobaculia bacterium]